MKVLHLNPTDSISDIINNLDAPATVYLSAGVYRQKIEILKNNVKIVGENRETTVITYDDYAKKIHKDGKEYNTFRTYTVCVVGENVKFENLTIENSNTDPAAVGQCVALSVNSKHFYAKNVNLKSTQDTLFLSPFPDDLIVRYRGFIPQRQLYREGCSLHLFENCRISGTVDFIFGGAEAYFKDCEIVSVYDNRHLGFIAAPSHSLACKHGFTFLNCRLINGGAGENEVFLARPWRDFGKCEFINCCADSHIRRELFDKWNDTERDKTARFIYGGLECDFKPEPVAWCKQADSACIDQIIARPEAKFTANNK